jgi:ubiquinone/menaquinone biosynthesis C-methylase UbiE
MSGAATGKVMARQASSNLEWQAWGEKDPLYGVIPKQGSERGGAAPWTDAEFYATGRSDWEEFCWRWERYGLNRESCLEIGCGAGRITAHLAHDFGTVHGIDVAEGMIQYARQHVPANVSLHVTDGITVPIPDESVTGVFSVIVFLHFDRIEYAASYFAEMARVLKPGGSIMIQMPLHSWPANLKPIVRKGYAAAHRAYTAVRRLKGKYHRFWLARNKFSPFMQSITYDEGWVREELGSLGFKDIETSSFRLERGGAVYSWVFARRM